MKSSNNINNVKIRIWTLLLTVSLVAGMIVLPAEAAYADSDDPAATSADAIYSDTDGDTEVQEIAADLKEADGHDPADLLIDPNPDAITKRVLSNTTIGNPVLLKYNGQNLNLREMLGENSDGYSVAQCGCTDGTYAYYIMVSSANQKGRVLKLRLRDNKFMGASGVLDVYHGNSICYDSLRGRLVIATYYNSRQRVVLVDADTLKNLGNKYVKFSYYKNAGKGSITAADRKKGITALSYNKRYDCLVTMQSGNHNIVMYDASTFEAIGIARTNVNSKYPGVWQSMDSDDQYVYFVLSKYNSKQPYNVIVALDWHSENLDPILQGKAKYIKKEWYCGKEATASKRTGLPTAAIKVNTPYEIESIFHTTDPDTGQAHFYLVEYQSTARYGWTTQKVKWKKVTKKVKWKKVNGKWKYKKKKVWKYKTKKVWAVVGLNRDDNVYDLGVF